MNTIWLDPHQFLKLSLFFFFSSTLTFGETGWVPKYKTLILKTGAEYQSSSENFDVEGSRQDLSFQNQLVRLNEFRFFVEPEYGFAQDWSALLQLNFLSSSLSPSGSSLGSLASITGFSDAYTAVKWRFRESFPAFIAEVGVKFPLYGINAAANDLVLGDGNADLSILLHTGFRSDPLFVAVSPGFVGRFGNYASAFKLLTAIGVKFPKIYGYLYSDLHASVEDNLFYNSSLTLANSNALGSGGSYSRLSESPTKFDLGLRLGFQVQRTIFIEPYFSATVAGKRTAKYVRGGLNAIFHFDFYEIENKTKLKEIPFDGDDNSPDPIPAQPE